MAEHHPVIDRVFRWLGMERLGRYLVPAFLLIGFFYELPHAIGAAPAWYRLVLMTLALLTVLTAGALVWLQRRTRIRLSKRWQALAWAHYRQVLSDIAARSVSANRIGFDFVTHHGFNFEYQLRGFFQELQYCSGALEQLDLVIFDIEYLSDLRLGRSIGMSGDALAKLIPIDDITGILPSRITLAMPALDRVLRQDGRLWAIPLRWGTTGVALKLDSRSKETLRTRFDLDIDALESFDLDLILDRQSQFRAWLADRSEPCSIVMLDWYLPVLLLLSRHYVPTGNTETGLCDWKTVLEALDSIGDLLHPKTPLFCDPAQLVAFVSDAKNVIVLGGGNWLLAEGGSSIGDVRVLPTLEGWYVWVECLGFLGTDAKQSAEWTKDAKMIATFLKKSESLLAGSARFSAFGPDDVEAVTIVNSAPGALRIRHLPPVTGTHLATRAMWVRAWEEWKARLQSQEVAD